MNRIFRVGTLAALACASAALAGEEPVAPRGAFVVAAGDAARGYLRGSETHWIEVHLAAGQVYSFAVRTPGYDNSLVLHASFRDPDGAELNAAAHMRHFRGGRIIARQYRARITGTYVVQLTAQSWFEGTYEFSSRIAGPRRAAFDLPRNGKVVGVDAAAGSLIRLRANGATPRLGVGLPGEEITQFGTDEPLLRALQHGGLTSSETGTYRFQAVDRRATAVEVVRPRWRSHIVDVTALPLGPAGEYQWVAGAWRSFTADESVAPPLAGVPVAADPATTDGERSTLFVGIAAETAIAAFAERFPATLEDALSAGAQPPGPESAPAEGPTDPNMVVVPADPAPTTPPPGSPEPAPAPRGLRDTLLDPETLAGTFATDGQTLPIVPQLPHNDTFGTSTFGGSTVSRNWRWSGWTGDEVELPLLPRDCRMVEETAAHTFGDASDPYARRQFTVRQGPWFRTTSSEVVLGHITTTSRYYVGGHQVASLLGTKGSFRIDWTVTGSGEVRGTPWSIDGSWRCESRAISPHAVSASALSWMMGPSFVINGSETFAAGVSAEKNELRDVLGLMQGCDMYRLSGTLTNTLSAPTIGLHVQVVRQIDGNTVDVTATTRVDPWTRPDQDVRVRSLRLYQIWSTR